MWVHLLRRLGQSVLVLLAVSFVSFLVFRHIGDPTISLLGEDATIEERAALTAELGFDRPVPVQYLRYVGHALQGDLGVSYRLKPSSAVSAARSSSVASSPSRLMVGSPMWRKTRNDTNDTASSTSTDWPSRRKR